MWNFESENREMLTFKQAKQSPIKLKAAQPFNLMTAGRPVGERFSSLCDGSGNTEHCSTEYKTRLTRYPTAKKLFESPFKTLTSGAPLPGAGSGLNATHRDSEATITPNTTCVHLGAEASTEKKDGAVKCGSEAKNRESWSLYRWFQRAKTISLKPRSRHGYLNYLSDEASEEFQEVTGLENLAVQFSSDEEQTTLQSSLSATSILEYKKRQSVSAYSFINFNQADDYNAACSTPKSVFSNGRGPNDEPFSYSSVPEETQFSLSPLGIERSGGVGDPFVQITGVTPVSAKKRKASRSWSLRRNKKMKPDGGLAAETSPLGDGTVKEEETKKTMTSFKWCIGEKRESSVLSDLVAKENSPERPKDLIERYFGPNGGQNLDHDLVQLDRTPRLDLFGNVIKTEEAECTGQFDKFQSVKPVQPHSGAFFRADLVHHRQRWRMIRRQWCHWCRLTPDHIKRNPVDWNGAFGQMQ